MIKMLIISRYTGHDASPYAGIKIHYHYLNKFNADADFSIKLISFCDSGESGATDFHVKSIDADVIGVDVSFGRALFLLKYNWQNIPNYFGRTMGLENGYIRTLALKKLKALKNQGYLPDVILLEWTQMLLMVRDIKIRTVVARRPWPAKNQGISPVTVHKKNRNLLFAHCRFDCGA
jgi:hypothetical protein